MNRKAFWLFIAIGVLGLTLFTGTLMAQDETAAQAQDGLVLANPLDIKIRPQTNEGQPSKSVDRFLPGQSVKMEGGREVRIFSDDGRIQITAQDGSVIEFEGMVQSHSKPWFDDRPVMVKDSDEQASVPNLVPQFRISYGQADIQVETGQELRVATPLIISAVRGTRFTMSVKEDGSSLVNVVEGRVMSMVRTGQVQLLEAGKAAELTAAKFTDFLREHNIKIPDGADWRSVDTAAVNRVVAQAFGNTMDTLGGALDTVKETGRDLTDKAKDLIPPKASRNPNELKKEMVAVP
ncbi:MAG: FecR family protein [Deltaproteobacteria bacterium]|jgi:hypothetical protein|nr:FecR family protein [Deltaproteobacteria bacterium]